MKKYLYLLTITLFTTVVTHGQTNTFPYSGNAGIGATTPAAGLEVQSAGEQLRLGYNASTYVSFTVDDAKNLSIGSAYPNYVKQLNLNYAGDYGSGGIKLSNVYNGCSVVLQAMEGNKLYITNASGNPAALTLGIHENPFDGSQFIAAYQKWYITDGNVGIGTSNPQSKLSVNGNITAKKLTVLPTGWPDYVFGSAYPLPSLYEIEKFIKKHRHLPAIRSAEEIEKEGLDVGENQAALLKKIEELTLYMIEMKKQLDGQQQEIAKLKDQLKRKFMESANIK